MLRHLGRTSGTLAFTAGVDGLADGEMAAGDETPATEEVPTGATNVDG